MHSSVKSRFQKLVQAVTSRFLTSLQNDVKKNNESKEKVVQENKIVDDVQPGVLCKILLTFMLYRR